MILVTGAAGKTGQAIVRALVRRDATVRALVYRPEQTAVLEGLGAREAIAGDVRDPETVRRAAAGAEAIYHICPNMHRQEVAIGEVVLAAARSAGCERFVYHSVLHPQTQEMPHHWNKLRVEEKLFESRLAVTILQPTAYMQNLLAGWQAIAERGVYSLPYAAETRISLVDLEDVAEAAATVLTEPGHEGAIYELSGPGHPSQHEVAAVLGAGLGRPVRVEVVPLATWKERARDSGLGDGRVETLTKMFRFYERHGMRGNPSVLGWLLGRPPTRLERFVRRVAGGHKAA